MKSLPLVLPILLAAGLGGCAKANAAPPADQPREFTVPLDRQQLIGVTFAEARTTALHRRIRAVGTVASATSRH
jgi:hypothetical protein